MISLISSAISSTIAIFTNFAKQFQVQRFFAVVLAGMLLLATDMQTGQNSRSLGERTRDRIQQVDDNSDRPKTTGEFLDEARGDVPLGKRLRNITRDSAEALQQFGQEYSVGAEESVRNLKNKAADASSDLANQVR